MKLNKTKILALLGSAVALLAVLSCSTPEYTDSANSDIKTSVSNANLLSYRSVTVNSVSATLSSDFIRGFDASDVDEQEVDKGITWYNSSGKKEDFFQILADNGVNTVRLRIWNDPETFAEKLGINVPSGDCTLERVIRLAKRVKAANLKFMLDFHYSDFWADPSKQIVPLAWQNLASYDEVSKALYDYTLSVIDSLNSAGATPDFVQIGNEINNGFLRQTSYNSSSDVGTGEFAYAGTVKNGYIATYLSSAAKAVRLAAPDAKIIVHVASSNAPDSTVEAVKNVDFDIIALSYYPVWTEHGTISELKSRIQKYIKDYGKDVIIGETTFMWNCDSSVSEKLSAATENLIAPDTSAVYSDLETGTVGDTENIVKGTIQNQANVIRHIIEESAEAGAVGVCTWGGEVGDWNATSNNWPYRDGASATPGTDYMMLPSLAVMGVKGN